MEFQRNSLSFPLFYLKFLLNCYYFSIIFCCDSSPKKSVDWLELPFANYCLVVFVLGKYTGEMGAAHCSVVNQTTYPLCVITFNMADLIYKSKTSQLNLIQLDWSHTTQSLPYYIYYRAWWNTDSRSKPWSKWIKTRCNLWNTER